MWGPKLLSLLLPYLVVLLPYLVVLLPYLVVLSWLTFILEGLCVRFVVVKKILSCIQGSDDSKF